MKSVYITAILFILMAPGLSFANESIVTNRIEASIEDNGNWQLTDLEANITWHGEWITKNLMRVTGSDNSCFILGENQSGMVQLDCHDLKQISILVSY